MIDPLDTFRDDFQTNVNNEIHSILAAMSETERLHYYREFDNSTNNANRKSPYIRILFSKNIQHRHDNNENKTTTNALSIECVFNDRSLVQDLLMKTTQRTKKFGQFFPIHLFKAQEHVNEIQQSIRGHNAIIRAHTTLNILGIDTQQMHEVFTETQIETRTQRYPITDLNKLIEEDFSFHDHLLKHVPGIKCIEKTAATKSIGKCS